MRIYSKLLRIDEKRKCAHYCAFICNYFHEIFGHSTNFNQFFFEKFYLLFLKIITLAK